MHAVLTTHLGAEDRVLSQDALQRRRELADMDVVLVELVLGLEPQVVAHGRQKLHNGIFPLKAQCKVKLTFHSSDAASVEGLHLPQHRLHLQQLLLPGPHLLFTFAAPSPQPQPSQRSSQLWPASHRSSDEAYRRATQCSSET
jgi:hypothetical protein